MKKILLLVFAFCLSVPVFSQGIFEMINRSNEFFELLDKRQFAETAGFFDESVKAKITKDDLELFWIRVTNQLGAFESVDGASSKQEGIYTVVSLKCKFNKGKQGFRFVYNKDAKLMGFFVDPGTSEAIYALPSYADSTLYKEELMTLKTPGHQLAAMLTIPRKATGNYPIVILVHGSGPGDMDETVGPNKPFKDVAIGLAAKGIATLRYVKRTLVYPAEFRDTAITVKEEVLDDALAAIAYAKTLPGVNKAQVYLLGHSLGGMLAPRIATLAPELNGIILAAAPARKFTDLMVEQNKYLFDQAKDTTAAGKAQFTGILKELERSRITKAGTMKPDSMIIGLPVSYWVDINQYDQVATAKRIKNRILVLQGGFDFQVSVQDYDLWKTALSAKPGASFKFYATLNHLLSPQKEKGNVNQYQQPVNVSANLISDIALWIKAIK